VSAAVVAALRQQGHDLAWIDEDAPGSPDPEVLTRAQRENRVVVTFDKDFGELAFRRGLAASVGVVLFRITLTSPDHAVRVAVAAFASRAERFLLEGFFNNSQKAGRVVGLRVGPARQP
jgi:predicted nuclease of predicted toxin-antitoxin system